MCEFVHPWLMCTLCVVNYWLNRVNEILCKSITNISDLLSYFKLLYCIPSGRKFFQFLPILLLNYFHRVFAWFSDFNIILEKMNLFFRTDLWKQYVTFSQIIFHAANNTVVSLNQLRCFKVDISYPNATANLIFVFFFVLFLTDLKEHDTLTAYIK